MELYKDAKGLSGREAYNYLRTMGAVDFIIRCWEGLHMTSSDYIVESIDEYIVHQLARVRLAGQGG